MKTIFTLAILSLITVRINAQTQTVKDIDGNTYKIVSIGNKNVFAQDLIADHYNNGNLIPNKRDDIFGKSSYYYNVLKTNENPCPVGWHVMNYYEFSSFMNLYPNASDMAKQGYWVSGGSNPSTNASGFSAIATVVRNPEGATSSVMAHVTYMTPDTFTSGISTEGSWMIGYAGKRWGNDTVGQYYYFNNGNPTPKADYAANYYRIRCVNDTDIITTGVQNYDVFKFQVYPNPTTDIVNIDWNKDNTTYQLMDISGKLVKSGQILMGKNHINVADLPQGLYLINIKNGNTSIQKKIVKNKFTTD